MRVSEWMLIHRPSEHSGDPAFGASLEPQRTLRSLSFFIAAERAAMKKHSAAESAAARAHAKQCSIGQRFEETHRPQVTGFCFSASQGKAK